MSFSPEDSGRFGFATERWFEVLRRAESPSELGRLGAYELLEEVGRGGQGVVFRARQPGTGREIAVKRLLAGAFASPQTLRRFEREVEAAVALNHPGIVTVYGVDLVEGAPLLTMEWVNGVPLTRWATGRPREEILALFLLVCDAVQHAHQRGVLHRDLKPSNVVVDVTGRPRVLDFGLAKLTTDSRASVTSSGDFLGTPAYAAPEQWRGEELDVRADVYSLGAILFEMLTGRRVVEGEGLQVLASAADPSPPRPSSIIRSIPRELDAITLQALASEREQRYQSLDAFAADVRRFLAGEPISAHPPGAWYLLRKLVARNRLASSLVVLLVGATFVYAALTSRHADQLATERDRALLAGEAEKGAHAQAEAEKKRAEGALGQADELRQRAEQERENTQQVLDFLATDVMRATDPKRYGHEPSLAEILRSSRGKVGERFGHSPLVAARVHRMLGGALHDLGSYAEAEAELRAALEIDPAPEMNQIAQDEAQLGMILCNAGEYDEAEALLRSAIEHYESAPSSDPNGLGSALDALAGVLSLSSRWNEALRLQERAIEVTEYEHDRLSARQNLGVILRDMGRYEEARAQFEQVLPGLIESEGELSYNVTKTLDNLANLDAIAGDKAGAVKVLRRSLEIMTQIFGPDHPDTAGAMARLSEMLIHTGELDEAEDLARRALAVFQASEGIESAFLHQCLGNIAWERGDTVGAEPYFAEALRLFHELNHRPNYQVAAESLFDILRLNGKLEEAEELLGRVYEFSGQSNKPWALKLRGDMRRARGDLEGAAGDFEEAIEILTPIPDGKPALALTLEGYAKVLRDRGDESGAIELELQATELRK